MKVISVINSLIKKSSNSKFCTRNFCHDTKIVLQNNQIASKAFRILLAIILVIGLFPAMSALNIRNEQAYADDSGEFTNVEESVSANAENQVKDIENSSSSDTKNPTSDKEESNAADTEKLKVDEKNLTKSDDVTTDNRLSTFTNNDVSLNNTYNNTWVDANDETWVNVNNFGASSPSVVEV